MVQPKVDSKCTNVSIENNCLYDSFLPLFVRFRWGGGQHAHLLLCWSKFKSRRSVQFYSVDKLLENNENKQKRGRWWLYKSCRIFSTRKFFLYFRLFDTVDRKKNIVAVWIRTRVLLSRCQWCTRTKYLPWWVVRLYRRLPSYRKWTKPKIRFQRNGISKAQRLGTRLYLKAKNNKQVWPNAAV